MTRIADLTRVTEIADGDTFPIEQASSARTRSVAFETIKDNISAEVDAAVAEAVAAAERAEAAAASSDAEVLRADLADGLTVGKGADLVAYDETSTVSDKIAEADQFAADLANPTDPAKGAAIVGYSDDEVSTDVKSALDAALADGLHPSMFGYAPGSDITGLLNTVQRPFDLLGDSYTVTAGITRTASLKNGTLTYAGAAPGTALGGIVEFTTTADLDGRRLYVVYTGSTAGVRGIVAHSGTDRINLRGAYAEGTTDNGIRVQGCDDPDLTGAGALNCMKDAIGSTNDALAYGQIAIFGGSAVCNRAKLLDNYVRGQTTAISVAYGDGHEIGRFDIDTIDPGTMSGLAMGIYCIGKLTNLEIHHGSVGEFANEGIDVHNTGGSAELGVSGISIHHNTAKHSHYVQISVVADPAFKIDEAHIFGNVVSNKSGSPLGYSGGIRAEGIRHLHCHGNDLTAATASASAESYGVYCKSVDIIEDGGNVFYGQWDRFVSCEDYGFLNESGISGDPVKSGGAGLVLLQSRANAVHTLRGVNIKGADGTARTILQGGTSLALTNFNMGGCTIDGQVQLTDVSSGAITGNSFNNFSGVISTTGSTIVFANKGYLNPQAGTTKTTPGTVDQWLPFKYGATTYYIPAYTSKTS